MFVVVVIVVVLFSSYGREDEEVMGLRFCNEAIMSLHQIWPRLEEPTRESLSPLQVSVVWVTVQGIYLVTSALLTSVGSKVPDELKWSTIQTVTEMKTRKEM